MAKIIHCALFFLLLAQLSVDFCGALFTEFPTRHLHSRGLSKSSSRLDDSSSSSQEADETNKMTKPILVVGATGNVGRRVVQQLLEMQLPVRALVRNPEKARELFSEHLTTSKNKNELRLVVCDLGNANRNELESAVRGCGAIVSVSGAMRFSKITDFLPRRLFRTDVTSWCDEDRSHPFYSNYEAQKTLIDLADAHGCTRFVRLTGLSSGFSPFNPVSMIFSSVLSLSSRYHFLCEQHLRNSDVPYVILRPGGLAEEDRDLDSTNLQVDPSGSLPPPGRVPRTDVAALAALSVGGSVLDPVKSYTLAVRAVGDMKPKPQGDMSEGYPTALDCLDSIRDKPDTLDKTIETKPYGLAAGIFVYSLLFLSVQLVTKILVAIASLF